MTAKSAPDGYTVMMGTIGTHAINYSLYSKLPYHPVRDFTPIALVGDSPNVLVTTPRVPANTVKEFIALAKSKPGQLNYGSSGAGTTVHLSGELFNTMAGVKTVHVPFKGASEALTALLGGQVDFMFASRVVRHPARQSRQAESVRRHRRAALAFDSGICRRCRKPRCRVFRAAAWFGIVGPAGIPQPNVAILSKAALSSLETKEVKDRLFASGVEIRPGSAEELGRLIKSETEKWAKVVKESGAKAD